MSRSAFNFAFATTSAVLSCCYTTQAQVFPIPTFIRDTTAFYRSSQELVAVRFDSARDLGNGDTIYYNYRVTVADTGLTGLCTHSIVDTPWTGYKIRMDSSYEHYFYNRWSDSILIATSMEPGSNDTYRMYTFPDGRYIEAKVISGMDETILGQSEYTRTHRLQSKTQGGIDTTHIFNGKVFKHTVRFGFAKTYNLFLFPTDTQAIFIAGAPKDSLGWGNTDSRTIFSIVPGDEFHYNIYDEFCGFSGCRQETTKEKRFYLERHLSALEDTLILVYQRTHMTYVDDPVSGLDTIMATDTQQQQLIFSQLAYLDGFNREDFYADSVIGTLCNCASHGWCLITFNDSLGPRPRKRLFVDFDLDTLNACLFPSANTGYDSTIIEYGDGLGLTRFYDTDNNIEWRSLDLVYYQKGIEVWGEPIDFSEVTGLKSPPRRGSVRLYPNPTASELHFFMSGAQQASIELFDATGKRVRSSSAVNEGENTLNVSRLSPGLYLVRVITADESFSARFIKL